MLIVDHHEKGTVGVVLNRPTQLTAADLALWTVIDGGVLVVSSSSHKTGCYPWRFGVPSYSTHLGLIVVIFADWCLVVGNKRMSPLS